MNKTVIMLVVIALMNCILASADQGEHYRIHPIAGVRVLNLGPGGTIPAGNTLLIEDGDRKIHFGSVIVFLDRKKVGIGGSVFYWTTTKFMTYVHIAFRCHPGKHILVVRDGMNRTATYNVKIVGRTRENGK